MTRFRQMKRDLRAGCTLQSSTAPDLFVAGTGYLQPTLPQSFEFHRRRLTEFNGDAPRKFVQALIGKAFRRQIIRCNHPGCKAESESDIHGAITAMIEAGWHIEQNGERVWCPAHPLPADWHGQPWGNEPRANV